MSERLADGLLKPLRHESPGASTERAAAYLRRLIFTHVLPPGSHVPADQVARVLGMTRIPVREALLVLQHEGRVRIESNRGAFVVPITERSARDSNDLFSVMETFAAEHAVKRATPEDMLLLEVANREVQAAADPVHLFHAYDDFQELIVTAGLDARLAGFFRRLRRHSPDTIYELIPSLAPMVKEAAERTLQAFLARDAALVASTLRSVREYSLEQLTPLLRSEGIIEG